ncbi:hypothetical protein EV175_001534, partial [Coemansia sp. RSA 1933]
MASVSIPLDAMGNPLPWSRDSIIRWAQRTGFAKFIPAFIQYGIEGYMFYTLKLEDIRQMRVPNATMQDMIQLNGAIYRLNMAAATPANRSHMSGTLRSPPSHRAAPGGTGGSHIHETQILSRPLQPLRPPRPSWTVRRDEPPTSGYAHQVQLTSNGMVARPVRPPARQHPTVPAPHPAPLPPRLAPQQKGGSKPGAIVYSQQLTHAKPLDPAQQLQNATREKQTAPTAPITINTEMMAGSPDGDGPSAGRPWTRSKGVSPIGDRPSRYGTGQSTYRSRNSAHVEVDELPLVRPTQNTWVSPTSSQQPQRRRSAVIEVFDDGTNKQAAGTPLVAEPAAGSTLPARYHGTNQPHSPYYAHGASVSTGSFGYRGAGGPASRSGTKFHTAQPYPAGRQRRGGTHGLFDGYAQNGGSGIADGLLSPQLHPEQQAGGSVRGMRRQQHPPPPMHPPPPAPMYQAPHVRRTSMSPVLTALQPGNYHIANLPDTDMDGSSSSESELAELPLMAGRSKAALLLPPPSQVSAMPLAINTTLLHDLQASPCDTGDSTITPLSVVNVLPGVALNTANTSPSSQATSHYAVGYEAYVPVEGATISPVIFDAESLAGSDDYNEDDDSEPVHFDLVENALPIEERLATADESGTLLSAVGEFEIWDAEQLAEDARNDTIVRSPTEAPPPDSATDDVQPLSAASSSASSVFRVMGVRHVSSYSPDFDKTAASLLSSIKTDIAKRVAS